MYSLALVVLALVAHAHGHGRMTVPPNRASLWRYGYNSPANYDDDGLNCGGYAHQWYTNGGKCGVCGDAYNLAEPRPHELGGKYGLGYIVAQYEPGQVFSVTIYLSVSHLGFWELRICPDPYNNNQECFDKYLLELETGGTKFYPLDGSKLYTMNYRLPAGLQCEHCVLQWQYTAGNNWGNCADGTQGLGCGNQEQFYTCSDIAILGNAENDISDEGNDQTAPDESINEEDDSNDIDNDIDDSSSEHIPAEVPYLPVQSPIAYLNGDFFRFLMGNDIAFDRPKKAEATNYKNRHKRTEWNRHIRSTTPRSYTKYSRLIPLYR